MMAQIKQLELAGDLAGLHQLAETLPAGDALARVFIALSKLAEDRATTGAEYRQALSFAQRAIAAADPGSLMWTWAQGRTSALAADLGDYRLAERAAGVFLGALPGHERAQVLTPWVYFALARVAASKRDHDRAVALYDMVGSPTPALAEQVRLNKVWVYARAGKPGRALQLLPQTVEHVGVERLHATRAAAFASCGDWPAARAGALAALRHGYARIYDLLETAELFLILKAAALATGQQGQASLWHLHTAAVLGWDQDLMILLAPTPPTEGGECTNAATCACGSSGTKRMGLLGGVG